jgi:hypothetical protein
VQEADSPRDKRTERPLGSTSAAKASVADQPHQSASLHTAQNAQQRAGRLHDGASALITSGRRPRAPAAPASQTPLCAKAHMEASCPSDGHAVSDVHKPSSEASDNRLDGIASAMTADEQAYTRRVRTWYQELLHYRANPETLEFTYLVLHNPGAIQYRPYDLDIVAHSAVTKVFYYTMSAQGVSQFNGGEATHVSLNDFERGYFLYKQVAKMRFFSRFRAWKVFRMWRIGILRSKRRAAAKALQEQLFCLDDRFRPTLCTIRAACVDAEAALSHSLLQPGAPAELESLKVRCQLGRNQSSRPLG